jgi:hypothetical protein
MPSAGRSTDGWRKTDTKMKKIMFNDKYGLTKAVLEGRKTITRRIVRNPEEVEINGHAYLQTEKIRYKPGEVVAVAQCYNTILNEHKGYDEIPIWANVVANRDNGCPGDDNKMFVRADLMPHQIRITSVRVERLQDISDGDVYKEGFSKEAVNNGWGNYAYHYEAMLVYYDKLGRSKEIRSRTPRDAYADLIDKVSGNGTWESNPWVFVYEFELVK